MSPTTVGRLIIATGAAAGWLLSSSSSQETPDTRDPRPSVARPIEVEPIPTAKLTEVLRDRMAEPAAPERGRNPFTYGSRVATPTRGELAVATEPEASREPVAPPAPVFRLSGIATSQEEGGAVRTAIVIDNGVMVFAKAGDTLSNGYSVVRVDEMSITLADAAGVTQTLRLP